MLKAKKSLGQNFLRSPKAIKDIVDSLQDYNLPAIEIGGGEGVVTEALLQKGFKVFVIEIDERAVEMLQEKFVAEIENKRLKIIKGDVLDLDFSKIINNQKYNLVGNIPYYITGLIIRHIFEQVTLPQQATLMVQKEVADRIMAKDDKESILSLSVKAYGEVSLVSTVKRGSFSPAPKVDSAIFTVKSIQSPFKDLGSEKLFFEIIKTAFKHPRKVASGNLKKYLSEDKFKKIKNVLIDSDCQNKRAEDIPLSVWLKPIF